MGPSLQDREDTQSNPTPLDEGIGQVAVPHPTPCQSGESFTRLHAPHANSRLNYAR